MQSLRVLLAADIYTYLDFVLHLVYYLDICGINPISRSVPSFPVWCIFLNYFLKILQQEAKTSKDLLYNTFTVVILAAVL